MPSAGVVRVNLPSKKQTGHSLDSLATKSNAVSTRGDTSMKYYAVAAARDIERASVWVFSFGDSGQRFDRRSNGGETRLAGRTRFGQLRHMQASMTDVSYHNLLDVTIIRSSRAFRPLLLFYLVVGLVVS